MKYVIDAKDKSLGRVASEAAVVLAGKNIPSYAPNKIPDYQVVITNVSKMKITGNKMKGKKYIRHSGYPGGQKVASMEEVIKKKGIEYVLRQAVSGMLPKNKLRKKMLDNIIISQ